MSRLLILADDLTGAIDTGIKMVGYKLKTVIMEGSRLPGPDVQGDDTVIIINTNTRHLSPEEAGRVLKELVRRQEDGRFDLIYKKTDSALRGNIGSELEAVLTASGERELWFIPAYPQINRTTIAGVQYIDGLPLAESGFKNDPFNPAISSELETIIGSQSSQPVEIVPVMETERLRDQHLNCIRVLDAAAAADLERIARVGRQQKIRLFAGCAGFAEYLPLLLGAEKKPKTDIIPAEGMIVISGSLNQVTRNQVEKACQCGGKCFTLNPSQMYRRDYVDSSSFQQFYDEVMKAYHTSPQVILQSDKVVDDGSRVSKIEEIRVITAENIGRMAAYFIRRVEGCLFLIVGGDVLSEVVKQLGYCQIRLICEILEGVVLCSMMVGGREVRVVAKSGGIGPEDAITRILRLFGVKKDM